MLYILIFQTQYMGIFRKMNGSGSADPINIHRQQQFNVNSTI